MQSQQEVADAIDTVLAQAMQPEVMHRRLVEALEAAAAPEATSLMSRSPLWSLPDSELSARSRAKQDLLSKAQRQLDDIDASIPVQQRAELKRLERLLSDVLSRQEVRPAWHVITRIVRTSMLLCS
jgi:hypothetical protein